MKLKERDTGAELTASSLENLIDALGRSKSLDKDGIYFSVHTSDLSDAIYILEQILFNEV